MANGLGRRRPSERMLRGIRDEAGTGLSAVVSAAWEEVGRSMAAHAPPLGGPVQARIVDIPIMGASSFEGGVHTLHVSVRAARSSMLRGLVAHEYAHMVLTEAAHPSHDFDLLRRIAREVAEERRVRGSGVLLEAQKHAQDIYADDIAFKVLAGELAVPFLTNWVSGNLRALRGDPGDRVGVVGLWVTNCFALAELERHALAAAGRDAYTAAAEFDLEGGFVASDRLVTAFRNLPRTEEVTAVGAALRYLCGLVADEAASRGL